MRLQWKYSLVINLSVIAILVALYFFDSIRVRNEMNALHALGAERGAELRKIADNTILNAVVSEIETTKAFDVQRLNQVLNALKREHPDMRDVLNIHISLSDTRIRSSLLAGADAVVINLDSADLEQIETKGATIHAVEGQNATAIVIKYIAALTMPEPVELEPSRFAAYEQRFDEGILPLDKAWYDDVWWKVFTEEVYVPEGAVISEEKGRRWRVTDQEDSTLYNLWKQDGLLWIQRWLTGYIQVLFDVPYIDRSIRYSLLMHAILIVIVGALLVILIDLTTNHLIMKPLERMTHIIQSAESGDLSLDQTYSSDEIGRATHNLVRMLWQLRDSHSKRIAALGQFAAGVAHEIRNPLNSIGMTAQHLKSVFSQPKVSHEDIEEAKELLDIVDQKIVELKQTSEAFLTLNRPRILNVEPVNLNMLVDQVLSEFTLIAEEAKVQIIRNYDANLPNVPLDAALMRQTLFNFVQNSIQAMPKGGSIYINTLLEQIEQDLEYAVIEIRDTGIGIPEEIQEQIYDAYFTTKDATGGIGLGLAISHQIITAHKGKIEVRSKMGMGTAFKISLPLNASTPV
ncbi:HAMP domain-containing protein [Candidatus Poribacteria bacterium]|nr:ATP-binding protein [Candidatus Poribacteria bacterium]MYA69204.1 HAMP domain-containing protein [Candidatus Poribacteria bacterium]MYH82638.1 HAMP domain-containing protein [Candidatus Poribacteria bacterium]MYK96417.1 HAMP domain-containing protein [Candidatus Poribacteria bacterium]